MIENGGCLLKIRETLHTLSPKERTLAQFIMDQAPKAVEMQIEEIAAACGVSVSTVVRLCKSLNYTGYKDLCRNLYSDLAASNDSNSFEDIHPGDEPGVVMRNICLSNIKAIENTMSMLDAKELEKAVQLLCDADRVDFYGFGNSGFVALDAANKFLRIDKSAIAHTDIHSQVLSALTLKPKDVAVLISYSGTTVDIPELARSIKKQGVPVVTITRFGRNPLSDLGDVRLYCSSTETMLRSGAMSSRIAQLTVVDVLYAAVCSRMFGQVKSHLEKSRTAVSRLRVADTKK